MTPDKIRFGAILLLLPLGALSISAHQNSDLRETLAHGQIQSGHNSLGCVDCHKEPNASWRQQIQANVQFAMGTRTGPVDFGYQPITSGVCLDCHTRPNERHPIYRFREPRFQEALETVDATSCLGCHSEHTNARAETEVGFCVACHADLEMKSDPVDVPHVTLIKSEDWSSCLGCHDFHGNHIHSAPKAVDDAYSVEALRAYLDAGPSPYGSQKQYEAKQP